MADKALFLLDYPIGLKTQNLFSFTSGFADNSVDLPGLSQRRPNLCHKCLPKDR